MNAFKKTDAGYEASLNGRRFIIDKPARNDWKLTEVTDKGRVCRGYFSTKRDCEAWAEVFAA